MAADERCIGHLVRVSEPSTFTMRPTRGPFLVKVTAAVSVGVGVFVYLASRAVVDALMLAASFAVYGSLFVLADRLSRVILEGRRLCIVRWRWRRTRTLENGEVAAFTDSQFVIWGPPGGRPLVTLHRGTWGDDQLMELARRVGIPVLQSPRGRLGGFKRPDV